MFPDDLVERNREWALKRKAEPLPQAESIPLAVVACYDPRLDGLLRPALGLGEGEGFLLRTAGAVVSPGALRSLTLAVYLFDVHQVLVVGHSSCRMASFPTADFVDAFRRRGVSRPAFGDEDLRTWAGAIPNPRQGVLSSVATIARAPQLPSDLAVAGAVLDDETGSLKIVFRPGDVLPLEPAPPGATAPETEEPEPSDREPPAPPPPVPQPAAPKPAPRRSAAEKPAVRRSGPPKTPLQALLPVIEDLSQNRTLRDELFRLRVALEREPSPVRQLVLLQQFVRDAAAESKELRHAFELLKREAVAAGPKVVTEFVLPLLSGRRRR